MPNALYLRSWKKFSLLVTFSGTLLSVFLTQTPGLSHQSLSLESAAAATQPKSTLILPAPHVVLQNPQLALSDPNQLIQKDFQVPEELLQRTTFWFDIYTKFGANHHIIHDIMRPWVIYDIVDTTPIHENTRLHKWTRYHRAKDLVKKEVARVRYALKSLSQKKSFGRLNPLEKKLFDALQAVPGKRSLVFKNARHNVRTQLGQKDFILTGLRNSKKYLASIEKMFVQAGLPTELSRLPFVESSYNEHAFSKVGASGIWQIMPKTGAAYLLINDAIDERNSPLKATLAAIEVLKTNRKVLGSWDFAVSAYNHGPYGIKNLIRKTRAKDVSQLIRRGYGGNFQFASANFYACFLAILHAKEYKDYLFTSDELSGGNNSIQPIFYSLNQRTRARSLARLTGVRPNELLEHNLDIRTALSQNRFLPKGFRILIPARTLNQKLSPRVFSEARLALVKKNRG